MDDSFEGCVIGLLVNMLMGLIGLLVRVLIKAFPYLLVIAAVIWLARTVVPSLENVLEGIELPAIPKVSRPATEPQVGQTTGGAPGTYTVQEGDMLSKIAKKFDTSVAVLVELNKDRYPSLETNPGFLQIGWELIMPTTPESGSPSIPGATSPGIVSEFVAPFTDADITAWTDPPEESAHLAALNGTSKILQKQQDLNSGKLGYSIFAWGGVLGFFNSFGPEESNPPTEQAFIQSLMGIDFTAPSAGLYRVQAEIELHGTGYAIAGKGAADFVEGLIPGEVGKVVGITNPAKLLPSAVHGQNAVVLKVQSAETRSDREFRDIAADSALPGTDELDVTFDDTAQVETTVQLNAGETVSIMAGLETAVDAWGNAGAVIKPLDSALKRIVIERQ